MFQEVSLLPAEVIVGHIQDYFVVAIGIDGFSGHALSAEVHVSGVGEHSYVLGQGVTGSYAMVFIIWRNQEKVVPDFVLCDFMLHRFFGEDKADTRAILYVLPGAVAVMNLKLQIRAGGNS